MTDHPAIKLDLLVKLPKFAELTGYTVKAVYRKIQSGVFRENIEYYRAPDGNLLIDLEAFKKWATTPQESKSGRNHCALPSESKAGCIARL